MLINNIELKNFRNYKEEIIEFNKDINVIYGDNAQGKTNIIESIFIGAFGKSYRTNKEKELIKRLYSNEKKKFIKKQKYEHKNWFSSDDEIKNDDIKNTVENCGCGLKVLSVREIENENVEVIMEVITEETHKPLYVNGERIIPPEDVCVLVTPFAGEYSVILETENAKGNREFLWGDDYIYK